MGISIARLKQERDVNSLIKLIGKEKFSQPAAEALTEIGIPAAEAVVELLSNTKNTSAFLESFLVVSKIGEACVQPLLKALADPKVHNRAAVANAIGNVSASVVDQNLLASMIDPLTGALQDPSLKVSSAVAEALGEVGKHITDSRIKSQIAQHLRCQMTHSNPLFREVLSESLKRLGKIPEVKSEDSNQRGTTKSNGKVVCPCCEKSATLVHISEVYHQAPESKKHLFSPPDEPVLHFGIRDYFFRNWMVLLAILIVIGIVAASLIGKYNWSWFIGFLTGIVIFILIYYLVLTPDHESKEASLNNWQDAMSIWRQLLYCPECSIFFDPFEDKAIMMDELSQYLASGGQL